MIRARIVSDRASQVASNDMDREVYRLSSWCETKAEDKTLKKADRALWRKAALALRGARAHLRQMMSEEDRNRTAGV